VELPLLPSGEKVPEGRMRGRFGIQGEAFHRSVFLFFQFQFPRVFVFTVASAPSSGPAGHLLPDGEKREIAVLQRPIATFPSLEGEGRIKLRGGVSFGMLD